MTTRSLIEVRCDCGNVGHITMSENDAPFSGMWERYSTRDLIGQTVSTTEFMEWDAICNEMGLACPACKAKLSSGNVKG